MEQAKLLYFLESEKHPRSLASAFAVRMHQSPVFSRRGPINEVTFIGICHNGITAIDCLTNIFEPEHDMILHMIFSNLDTYRICVVIII